MITKRFAIIGLVLLSLSFSTFVAAETIVLKSGKKIEGEILQQTDKYIKIDYYGVPLTYYLEDIEGVGGRLLDHYLQRGSSSQKNSLRDSLIVNDIFGFIFKKPHNWFDQPRDHSRSYTFTEQLNMQKGSVPRMLLVSIDPATNFGEAHSAYEYAADVEHDIRNKDPNFYRIVKPAKHELVNGYESATLTYEKSARDDIGNTRMIIAHNFYFLDNDVVVIMFSDGDKTFYKNLPKMKKYMESFQRMHEADIVPNLKDYAKREYTFSPASQHEFDLLRDKVTESMQSKKTFKSVITTRSHEAGSKPEHDSMLMVITYVSPTDFEADTVTYTSAEGGPADTWRVVGDEIYFKIGLWMPFSFERTQSDDGKNNQVFSEIIKGRKEYYKHFLIEKTLNVLKMAKNVFLAKNNNYTMLKFNLSKEDFNRLNNNQNLNNSHTFLGNCEILFLIYNPDNTVRYLSTTYKTKTNENKTTIMNLEQYYYGYDIPYTLGKPLIAVSAEECYAKGMEYAFSDDFERAQKEFEKSLEINKFYRPAKNLLKMIKDVQRGDIKKETAIYIIRGEAKKAKGIPNEAISEYKKALQINPEYKNIYILLGIAYYDEKRIEEATVEFMKALRIDPNCAPGHLALGVIDEEKGNYRDAINRYKQALKSDPDLIGAYLALGLIYHDNGMLEAAITEFNNALNINPNYAMTHFVLGEAYKSKQMYAESIFEYKKALSLNPNYAEAYHNLGRVYWAMEKHEEAIIEWEKAIEINPKLVEPHCALTVAYYAKKQYKRSIKHCDKALELGGKIPPDVLKNLEMHQ